MSAHPVAHTGRALHCESARFEEKIAPKVGRWIIPVAEHRTASASGCEQTG